MTKRKTQSCLDKSFIDISNGCLRKARQKFQIKEKGLVKMAEKTICRYGIGEDSDDVPEEIDEYFRKLRVAFGIKTRYYLNSDYVFLFEDDTLVDIISIHEPFRNAIQNIFKVNKRGWDTLSIEEQNEFAKNQKEDFLMDAGVIPRFNHRIGAGYEEDDDYWQRLDI